MPRVDLPTELLPGAPDLLAAHARELPQRDDLCGAFCGSLALAAAARADSAAPDQDDVAILAGSVIAAARDPATLPHGETGRRDYRLEIPTIDDPDISGTTAAGVASAVAKLGGGRLQAVPLSGPFTPASLDALFDAALALSGPATLIANHATRHLWGSHPGPELLLAHLLEGTAEGPAPDWDVGHFACVFARTRGPGGTLYWIADTYPSLGARGVHLQPRERLAHAIARPDIPAGGVLAVVDAADAGALREAARAAGLQEGLWDNGSPDAREAA